MIALIGLAILVQIAATSQPVTIIVVGAPGDRAYAQQFARSAQLWHEAAEKGQARSVLIGLGTDRDANDLGQLQQVLGQQALESTDPIWLVLIGHGTYDGRSARFNLKGPDLVAEDLARMLGPFKRPVVLINTASCSGPFIPTISGPGRIVITATRSGFESSATRFGYYLADAIADPNADLDKDGQTSILEAFLIASRRTSDFYAAAGRLATEHALLDDNGDRLGTPADWFSGLRPVKKAQGGTALDGYRAHQVHLVCSQQERAMPAELRQRRDQLELDVIRLRDSRDQMPYDQYLDRLEALLLELAGIYQEAGGL